jgi:hypothetical protein
LDLVGDFNVIESLVDRIGGQSTTGMRQDELSAWNSMMLKFGISDTYNMLKFCKLTKKRFTWDSGQEVGQRLASCIHRIYINNTFQHIGGSCGIWPFRKMFDYSPFFVKFKNWDIIFLWIHHFNKQILDTEEGRKLLSEIWKTTMQDNQEQPWAVKMNLALSAIRKLVTLFQNRRGYFGKRNMMMRSKIYSKL